jgi:hypothetical protein
MKRQFVFGTMFVAALAVSASAQQTYPQTQGQSDRQTSGQNQAITLTGCLVTADSLGAAHGATGAAGTATGSATGSATGTTSSAATAAGGDKQYVLTHASMGSASGTTAAGTTGTGTTGSGTTGSGTTGSATSGTTGSGSIAGAAARGVMYRLMGGDNEQLQQFVNSRVEVSGTLNNRGAGSGGAMTGTGSGTTGSATTGSGTTGSATTGSATGSASGTMSGQQHDMANMPSLRITSVRQVSGSCQSGGDR